MAPATQRQDVTPDGIEFIRFCYRRRKTGWPEIYDEMCAVAARGLFRGWSHEDLAGHGIAFSLAGLPALAAVVRSTIEAEPQPRPVVRRPGGAARPDVEPIAVPVGAEEEARDEAAAPPRVAVLVAAVSMASPDPSSRPLAVHPGEGLDLAAAAPELGLGAGAAPDGLAEAAL